MLNKMSLQEILNLLTEQNIITKFRGESDEYHKTFVKFTDTQNILNVINYINLAVGLINVPVSFISYEHITDELTFNTHFYNKINQQIIWVGKSIEPIKWTHVIQNKYILTFPSASKVGRMLNTRLQAIDKIL